MNTKKIAPKTSKTKKPAKVSKKKTKAKKTTKISEKNTKTAKTKKPTKSVGKSVSPHKTKKPAKKIKNNFKTTIYVNRASWIVSLVAAILIAGMVVGSYLSYFLPELVINEVYIWFMTYQGYIALAIGFVVIVYILISSMVVIFNDNKFYTSSVGLANGIIQLVILIGAFAAYITTIYCLKDQALAINYSYYVFGLGCIINFAMLLIENHLIKIGQASIAFKTLHKSPIEIKTTKKN